MASERIRSFEEFWPYYVREHRNPVCRALHYAGTTAAIGFVAGATLTGNPLLLVGAAVAGYGPAWVGHFVFEKNRPASFRYPGWSLRADLKMYGLALRGQMSAELARLCAPEVDITPARAA